MAKDLFANMGNAKPSVRPIKFRQLEHMEKELLENKDGDLDIDENGSTPVYPLVMLPIDKLILDPDNEVLFGKITEASIINFILEIDSSGFKGAIMAYPVVTNEGEKYEIESGHRRYLAAKSAGVKELPVIITKPPLSDAERRIRLAAMNFNNREKLTPCQISNLIASQIEDYTTLRKEQGLDASKDTIFKLICRLMNLSKGVLYKYLSLRDLIPELQALADDGVAWSALSSAASLSEDKQNVVALRISNEISKNGKECISRKWIESIISQVKEGSNEFIPAPKQVAKRRNGIKIITKCLKDFDDILSGNAKFKDSEKQVAIDDLKKLRDNINKKIAELSEELI